MEVTEKNPSIDESLLQQIISITADGVFDSSGNIFRQLVNQIMKALNVEFSYIGELCPDDPDSVSIIYGNFKGQIVEDEILNLDGTPCKNVVNQIYRYYPSNVAELFPGDGMAIEMGIESYAAIPLFDSKGNSQGLMVIMHTQPLTDPELVESLLKIFSVRASIELERLYTKRASELTEEQYKTVFNKSLDGLILLNMDGKIADVNPAWARMHGYSREEVLSMRPENFIPPESQAAFREFVKAAMENKPFHTIANGLRKDGTRYLADVRGVHMEYQGKPHILAILRDVTEQVEHETALRNSQNRLRATIDVAMDCIVAINSDGEVMEFNPAAEQTFGYKKEEATGKLLANLIIPERFRHAHNSALAARKGKNNYRVAKRREITAMRADGTEFPIELTIDVAHDKQGEIYIGYLRDITDRIQAEEERTKLETQLRQSQKMQAIGHLAGGIAHDFNNILTGVLGYVVLAQEKAGNHPDSKIESYLERAHRSGQKARDLIQQLLTFSRGQRGEPRPVELSKLVSDSIKLLGSTLPATIEIESYFEKNLPKINVDPVHIEQVLMNLCINARDAMTNSGRLKISVKLIDVDDQVCSSCKKAVFGKFVELSVQDTGSGMPLGELDRIFEPFYSTKEVGKGTGMGLSTVHGIVHEYHSHIIVESEINTGSCFKILLKPMLHSHNQYDSSLDGTDKNVELKEKLNGHVLLVDDEESVSEFMEDLLDTWGLRITTFNSSIGAWQHFQKHHSDYSLAILDQSMPKLTGLELAERIININPSFPIVMYTGFSDNIPKDQLDKLGILALIKKPVDLRELHSVISPVLYQS